MGQVLIIIEASIFIQHYTPLARLIHPGNVNNKNTRREKRQG